jgi:hypothetical protein
MNEGENFKIPKIFLFIMKYISSVMLLGIMLWWLIHYAIPILLLTDVELDKVLYIWGARILMFLITAGILFMIKIVWSKRQLNNR